MNLFQAEIDAAAAEAEAERREVAAAQDAELWPKIESFPSVDHWLTLPVLDWEVPHDCPTGSGAGAAKKRRAMVLQYRADLVRDAARYSDIRNRRGDAMSTYDVDICYRGSVARAVLEGLKFKRNHIASHRAWLAAIERLMRKLGESIPVAGTAPEPVEDVDIDNEWDEELTDDEVAAELGADGTEEDEDEYQECPNPCCSGCGANPQHTRVSWTPACGPKTRMCKECYWAHREEDGCETCGICKTFCADCGGIMDGQKGVIWCEACTAKRGGDRATAAAEAEGERLTQTLLTPQPSISATSGAMEKHSPLLPNPL